MGIRKMTFERKTLAPSFFLALVGWFYLNQPIEAFKYQGFPIGAMGYQGFRRSGSGRVAIDKGSCTDFTREDCQKGAAAYSNTEMRYSSECKADCALDEGGDNGEQECQFYIFEKKKEGALTGRCLKYSYLLTQHDETCSNIGGPPLPSVDTCNAAVTKKDCLSAIDIDCTYPDLVEPRHNVPDIARCQSYCLAHWRCKFFVYNKDKNLCNLYGSTAKEKKCKKVRGPRKTKLEGCPKSSLKVLSTPSDFVGGQCPLPSAIYRHEDGKDYCCCDRNCCFNKCTLDEPSFECLKNVPNSQWIFSEELGYWQAFQYNSETTNMLNREMVYSARAAQTRSAAPRGTVSVYGDAVDPWHICLPSGGPLLIHCPNPGNSLGVSMSIKANDCWWMTLENHEGCNYYMPESAPDRVDNFIFERVPLPLIDYQTRVVRDLIIMVPKGQNEEVFLLSK